MNDPTILFVKPGAIKAPDKTALHDAGVVVVEVEDPHSVKLVRATSELPAGALLAEAVNVIAHVSGHDSRTAFVRAIAKLIPVTPL